MNLHGIAAAYVGTVNPQVVASYQQSTGYTVGADGTSTPSYAPATSPLVQKQPMSFKDLSQLNGLNINGEKATFFVSGNWQGVARAAQRGGDLITLPDGTVWLVVQILENWFATSGWCKVAGVLQNGS